MVVAMSLTFGSLDNACVQIQYIQHSQSSNSSISGMPPLFPPNECLGRLGDPEVWPGCEVEVSDGPHRVSAHHPELVNVPVGVMRLVEDGHLETRDVNNQCSCE